MKIKLSLLLFVALIQFSLLCVHADSWIAAHAKDYFSSSSNYVAHITPRDEGILATMDMYSIQDGERSPEWGVGLCNPVSPAKVYISNDGQHVITFDDWAEVGYGDNVVAIYNRKGLLRNYSLKEIVPSLREFDERIEHSTSSRWWRKNSFGFFDSNDSIFCLWLDWDSKWLAWDMLTGEIHSVSSEQITAWNKRGREELLGRIRAGDAHISEYEFLGKLKIPDDKNLIEKLLDDAEFNSGSSSVQSNDDPPVFTFTSRSFRREAADRILTVWNEVPINLDEDDEFESDERYTYLASLQVNVKLPDAPKKGEGNLIVYLQDAENHDEPERVPVHYLFADLEYNFPYSYESRGDGKLERTVRFSMKGVTPGTYYVHALWDKASPFLEKESSYTPSKGDLYAKKPSKVVLRAGESLENILIRCTTLTE